MLWDKENIVSTPPIELSFTWLLQQIDTSTLSAQFKVDLEGEKTKTPRRNEAVSDALVFTKRLIRWCYGIEAYFEMLGMNVLEKHNPALPDPSSSTPSTQRLSHVKDQYKIFNPILPLMEDAVSEGMDEDDSNEVDSKHIIGLQTSNTNDDDNAKLLKSKDMSKLLNEHVRTLDVAVSGVEKTWTSSGILSSTEATLVLITSQLTALSTQYSQTMDYIESLLETSLIAAIGKSINAKDVATFVQYHEARLLSPKPLPFSHAIRRPEHYPVGLLTIESIDGESPECIYTHTREVAATSSLKVPLNAATVLELTGGQFLHGYMNQRFGNSHKRHQLVARSRQFSSFILVVGNMIDGSTLDPKDAIIVQNKDELIIPLLLEEMPTAKEFKDAIQALSPEQQRFAKSYRSMQLSSSVFGVCIVQIKPQLETLLGLPADALDKEMKLTQDLMELFVEYQVPSDLLSYNGFDQDAAVSDKINNVRENVKGVLDVITAEKEKQLNAEAQRTEMAVEQGFGSAARDMSFTSADMDEDVDYYRSPLIRARMDEDAQYSMDEDVDYRQERNRASFNRLLQRKSAAPRRAVARSAAPQPMAMMACSARPMAQSAAPRMMARSAAPQSMVLSDCYAPELVNYKRQESYGREGVDYSARSLSLADDVMEESQEQEEAAAGGKQSIQVQSTAAQSTSDQGVDFTLIPQALDKSIETSGGGNALRSTTIKSGSNWIRNRQANLLTKPKKQGLSVDDIKKEKNKAFDLLDALSRSGSLALAFTELHVIVCLTHAFDKDVMSTVVCDNVNPIEKLEHSTLLLASAVHNLPPRELIGNVNDLQRLEEALPNFLSLQQLTDS